jgi:hypothetical protein
VSDGLGEQVVADIGLVLDSLSRGTYPNYLKLLAISLIFLSFFPIIGRRNTLEAGNALNARNHQE